MGSLAEQIGQRIREAREGRGWSQADLALMVGRTQTAVSYWEAGRREPSLDDLATLAGLFGIELGALIANAVPGTVAACRAWAVAAADARRADSAAAWERHDYTTAIYERGVADGLAMICAYDGAQPRE